MSNRFIVTIILAVFSLTALLPVGMIFGVASSLWNVVFLIHLIAWIATVSCCLKDSLKTEALGFPWKKLVFCVWAIFLLVEATHPIIARDALIHHLIVPRWWIEQGSIHEIPWHEWSYYPMLLQLAYTGILAFEPMGLNLENVCTVYHASYLLFGLFFLLKSAEALKLSASSQVFLTVLTLTLPLLLKLSAIPIVDLGLFAFCCLALWILIDIFTTKTLTSIQAVFLGMAFGAAMASKYNGLLFVVLLAPFFLLAIFQTPKSIYWKIRFIVLSTFFTVLVFSPWMIKNYQWTSNPIFPLAKSVFAETISTDSSKPTGTKVTFLDRELSLYERSLLDVFLLPFTMALRGQDDNPRYFDGTLSPLLLLSLLVLPLLRRDKIVRVLSLQVISYSLIAVLLSGSRVRYLVPAIPTLLLLSTIGLAKLIDSKERARLLWTIFILLQSAWATYYIAGYLHRSGAIYYISKLLNTTDKTARELYLTRYMPEYSAASFVNQTLAKNDRLYLLYTANYFYLYHSRTFSGGFFSEQPLIEWISSSKNAGELASKFKEQELSHLLVHLSRFNRSFFLRLTPEQMHLWNEFNTSHLELLGSDGEMALWKLN